MVWSQSLSSPLVLRDLVALLVLPVGRKSLLRYLVHTVGADLQFDPLALVGHERHVERLIAVGLGMVHPVAQAVGMAVVDLADSHVD